MRVMVIIFHIISNKKRQHSVREPSTTGMIVLVALYAKMDVAMGNESEG